MKIRGYYLLLLIFLALSLIAASSIPSKAPPAFLLMWGWGVADGTSVFQTCTSGCQEGSSGDGAGQLTNPRGVAVEGSGKIYVVDSNNNRIQKFDSAGTLLDTWGTNGTGAGEFVSPNGITADSAGDVYVVDPNSHRIQKFDANGTFLLMWGWGVDDGADEFQTCTSVCLAGTPGSSNGQFEYPSDVATDAAGDVYVVDSGNRRIQKFDSTGTYLTQWGEIGNTEGRFSNPFAVAVDTAGDVYVTDSANHRIQKFDGSGNFLLAWGWGVDDGADEFQTCTVNCQSGTAGSNNGQLDYPYGVDVDASGAVHVADNANHRVQRFESDGTFMSKSGAYGTDEGQFSGPFAVAVDAEGNVYVTDHYNHRLQKFGGPWLETFVGEPEAPGSR